MRKLRVYIFQNVSRILLTLFLLSLIGCDKEVERLDNFLIDFATVIKQGSNYIFKLDDGTLLTPDGSFSFNGNTGDRIILNWIPSDDNIVKINRASSIYTGTIQKEGYPNQYKNDPIKIQSIWVSGDYLNMILEFEYHSISHSIAVFRDMESQTVDLYFAHTTNNDPKGYPQIMYASFLISNLLDVDDTLETPFNLYINTNNGIRSFQFVLKNN